jgi:hypothetical protein
MKKLNLFLFWSLLVSALVLTGCAKDEDPIVGNPSIDFKGGSSYTFADVNLTTNDQILVGIMAAMHPETMKPLTRFQLTVGESNLVDSTFSANTFDADYSISFNSIGTATLTARITDSNGSTDEVSFKITIEEGGVKVSKSGEFLLGNVNDLGAGSFYATTEDSVYFTNNVLENTSKIDFAFFKGPQNQNTIASPDDDDVRLVYPSMGDWPSRNQTRFQLTELTVADFDAIGEYHIFPEFSGTLTKANELENGAVIYFRTQAGKHGLIKIVDLYTRGDVALIDVLVEE